MNSTTVQNVIMVFIRNEFHRDRIYDLVDHERLRSSIQFLKTISENVAKNKVSKNTAEEDTPFAAVEARLLHDCQRFYQEEAEAWLHHGRLDSYCHQAVRRLQDEWERCKALLGEPSAGKMVKLVGDEVIRRRLDDLKQLEARDDVLTWLQDEESRLLSYSTIRDASKDDIRY